MCLPSEVIVTAQVTRSR